MNTTPVNGKHAYKATFSFGTVTRNSNHNYLCAAVAVKDGKPLGSVQFSAKAKTDARMPGDHFRRSARCCHCYNDAQRAELRRKGDEADMGWTVECVPVEIIR
jgi:hypothetical protein